MEEYYEIISHLPVQYFDKLDEIKILIIETENNIHKELSKYNIKNIVLINDLTKFNFNFSENYDIIILEHNYNLNNSEINKLINNTKILIHPQKIESTNFILRYFDWFKLNSNDEIKSTHHHKIKINQYIINYYSNELDPLNYFVNFKNYNNLQINTKYYSPENHFKYFISNNSKQIDNVIMGVHIMLDFDKVEFALLENVNYIKKLMNDIATEEKFIVLDKMAHKFNPQGYTLIFLLSTSHFSIHTYPEFNKCSIDLYSCDRNVDYNNVINKLKIGLKSNSFRLHQVIRKI